MTRPKAVLAIAVVVVLTSGASAGEVHVNAPSRSGEQPKPQAPSPTVGRSVRDEVPHFAGRAKRKSATVPASFQPQPGSASKAWIAKQQEFMVAASKLRERARSDDEYAAEYRALKHKMLFAVDSP